MAFNDGSPFKPGAQAGYPHLEKILEPGALNAVHIFDAERAAVYLDDCCHYTIAGNRLLADFIARAVLSRAADEMGMTWWRRYEDIADRNIYSAIIKNVKDRTFTRDPRSIAYFVDRQAIRAAKGAPSACATRTPRYARPVSDT